MSTQNTESEPITELSEDYRTKYYLGVVGGILLNVVIPFFFIIGIVEVFMQQDTKKKAYERLENPWLAGLLRVNKFLLLGFGIILLLLIVLLFISLLLLIVV